MDSVLSHSWDGAGAAGNASLGRRAPGQEGGDWVEGGEIMQHRTMGWVSGGLIGREEVGGR
jgi:hypothetical protein